MRKKKQSNHNANKNLASERKFQFRLNSFIAVLSFILGFASAYLIEIRSETVKKDNLAKLIWAAASSDLRNSATVQNMLRERITRQNFNDDSDWFEMWSDIAVADLPSGDDLGYLSPDIIVALKSYSLGRTNARHRFEVYRDKLRNKSQDNIEIELMYFCISQDAMIVSGLHLLDVLSLQYPTLGKQNSVLPAYVPIPNVITNLEESVNKSLVSHGTNTAPVHFAVGYAN
jgi:hypothetical protein